MTDQQIVDRLTQNTSQPAHSEAQDGPYVASVGSSAEKTCDRDEVAGRARLPGTAYPHLVITPHLTLCPRQWLTPCVWRGG